MNSTDCLAATGVDILPLVVAAIVLVGIGAALFVAMRRRGARAGLGVLMLLAVVGLGLSGAPAPAQAACPPAATNSPQPVYVGSISGTYTHDGARVVVTDPPGFYPTDPGTDWNLPTVEVVTGPTAASLVTLVWAGPDSVFGNADDVTTTKATDANGYYEFTGLADGAYRVTTPLPVPSLEQAQLIYTFSSCIASFEATPWSWTTPPTGVQEPSITGGANVTGVDFHAENEAPGSAACS